VVFRRDRPAANKKMHIKGKVFMDKESVIVVWKALGGLTINVRVLRPLVSMRNKVGIVNTTWIAP
jgi:hypothetical protein